MTDSFLAWMHAPDSEFHDADPSEWAQMELKMAAGTAAKDDLIYFLRHRAPSSEAALKMLELIATRGDWQSIEVACVQHRFGKVSCKQLVSWVEKSYRGQPKSRSRVYEVIRDQEVIARAIKGNRGYVMRALLRNKNLLDEHQEAMWSRKGVTLRPDFLQCPRLCPNVAVDILQSSSLDWRHKDVDVYAECSRLDTLRAAIDHALTQKRLRPGHLVSILSNPALPPELGRAYLVQCIKDREHRGEALSIASRFYKMRVELLEKRPKRDHWGYMGEFDEIIVEEENNASVGKQVVC